MQEGILSGDAIGRYYQGTIEGIMPEGHLDLPIADVVSVLQTRAVGEHPDCRGLPQGRPGRNCVSAVHRSLKGIHRVSQADAYGSAGGRSRGDRRVLRGLRICVLRG